MDEKEVLLVDRSNAPDMHNSIEELVAKLARLTMSIEVLHSNYINLERRILREIKEGPHHMIQALQAEVARLKRKQRTFVDSKTREHSNLIKSVWYLDVKVHEVETVASRRKELLAICEKRIAELQEKENESKASIEEVRKWTRENIDRNEELSWELTGVKRRADMLGAAVYVLLCIALWLSRPT